MTGSNVIAQGDEFWEKCARHQEKYTARNVSYFFLCDDCTDRLIRDALNNRAPIYHGWKMQGFCGLCNELTDVALRQWFMCPPCYQVVASYQKGFTAAAAMHEFWSQHISRTAPGFVLKETDVVRLTPYVRREKTKRQAAEHLDSADFLVSERVGDTDTSRFHIELKAGPGSIADMSEFQLDINDYNDIVGTVRNTKLPVYIIHIQLGMEYFPPTRRSIVRDLWWTDIFELTRNLKRKSDRRDERKAALYFDPKAFKSIKEFPDQIKYRRFEDLAARVGREPITML